MNKINLFTSYWVTNNKIRQAEIDDTLERNIANPLIDRIFLYLDDNYLPPLLRRPKISIIDRGFRPTYKNYINFINGHALCAHSYNMIANGDIYFDDTLKHLKKINMENTCVTLNRWEIRRGAPPKLLNQPGSQDVWIFKGKIKQALVDLVDIPLGFPCCDNVFLWRIYESGYNAGCPSFDIKAYHNHASAIRSYQEYTVEKGFDKNRVKGHHMYIIPHKIDLKKKVISFGKEHYDTHHPYYVIEHINDKDFKPDPLYQFVPQYLKQCKTYSTKEVYERINAGNRIVFALFTSYWQSDRQQELEYCLRKNIDNPLISIIYLFCENAYPNVESNKIAFIDINRPPTYADYFAKINEVNPPRSIIANSDIYFKESIKYALNIKPDECYALSRYDILPDGKKFFKRKDSQDAWIFAGQIKENVYSDFQLGILGCDNRIAHELQQAGYKVTNPSKTIKGYHVHSKHIGHDKSLRIPKPYLHIPPCMLQTKNIAKPRRRPLSHGR